MLKSQAETVCDLGLCLYQGHKWSVQDVGVHSLLGFEKGEVGSLRWSVIQVTQDFLKEDSYEMFSKNKDQFFNKDDISMTFDTCYILM